MKKYNPWFNVEDDGYQDRAIADMRLDDEGCFVKATEAQAIIDEAVGLLKRWQTSYCGPVDADEDDLPPFKEAEDFIARHDKRPAE